MAEHDDDGRSNVVPLSTVAPCLEPHRVIDSLRHHEFVTASDFLRSGCLCIETAADSIETVEPDDPLLETIGKAVEQLEAAMEALRDRINPPEGTES